jgi:hypothetical protein
MNTKTHRLIRHLTIVGASSALALLAVPTANAAAPGVIPLGDFACSDGSSISPVAKDVAGFMHSDIGFVDGRAIAPRWFSGEESGVITITSGSYKEAEVPYSASFSGPANGRRGTEPDLAALTRCTSGPEYDEFSITIDRETIEFTRIDPKYLGATADVAATRDLSVYLQPQQLAHR